MISQAKKRLLAVFLLLLLAAGCVAVWRFGLLGRLSDREQLIALLRSDPVRGPLVCIGIQFLQVVIFLIPGEITQFAAGYVFGAWKGFACSITGIMLGSAFNFVFGRVVGRPALERILGAKTMARVDGALGSAKGKSALFVLFLLPGLPKDAMSYGAGLSGMGLREFVVVSGLGRTPALVASILLGAQAQRRDWSAMVATALVVAAAGAAAFWYERRRSRRSAS